MSVDQFARVVCAHEGLKVQVNIAQVKEILKVLNKLLKGALYKYIRSMEQ